MGELALCILLPTTGPPPHGSVLRPDAPPVLRFPVLTEPVATFRPPGDDLPALETRYRVVTFRRDGAVLLRDLRGEHPPRVRAYVYIREGVELEPASIIAMAEEWIT